MRRFSLLMTAAAVAACTNQPFTLDVPLRVVASSPSSGATGVARKAADGSPAAIVTSVSEELDPLTVTNQSVSLANVAADGTLTPVDTAAPAFSIAPDGRFLITVVPSARLAYSQKYRLTFTTDLRRKRDGGRMPTTVKSEFTTEDPPALGIVFSKPSDGGNAVDGPTREFERTPVMKVRFTEPVDCASVNASTIAMVETFDPHPHTSAQATRTVPGTWKCNSAAASNPERLEGTDCLKDASPDDPNSECVITFQPADAVPVFAWSSRLSVALLGGASTAHPLQSVRATAAGGQLPATATERSAVVNPPALSLTSSTPSASATGVARDAALVLNFSEPVDCAQLKAKAVVEELRDPHPHIPAPSAPEAGNARARVVSGTWTCPDLSAVPSTDHSCGADGSRCRVGFAAAKDTNNAAEADAKPFEYSSTVRVTLPGGGYGTSALLTARGSIESARATSQGGELDQTTSFSFRTEDPPSLAVLGSSPANGARGVPRDAPILLQFSSPVDCGQLLANATVQEVRDAHAHVPVPAQLAAGSAKTRKLWPGAGGTWTCPAAAGANFAQFTPAADPAGANTLADDGKAFAYSSVVKVLLNGGTYASHLAAPAPRVTESAIATTWGGALPGPAAFTFRTEDPAPLLLTTASPGNGATGVLRSQTSVALSFNQNLDCAESPLSSTQVVEAYDPMVATRLGAPSAPVAGVASACAANTFTWAPSAAGFAWQYSSGVSATLSAGSYGSTTFESVLATTQGGQLAAGATSISVAFATVNPDPLVLLGINPSDGAAGIPSGTPVTLTFSRAVDPATFSSGALAVSQANVAHVDGTSVAGGSIAAAAASAFASTTVYSWQPAAAYNPSAVVTATLSAAAGPSGILATDATTKGGWLSLSGSSGNARSVAFRAQDPGALSIAFTQPNQGGAATGDASILAVFSRAINCGPTAVAPAVAATAIGAIDTSMANTNFWKTTCTGSDPKYAGAGSVVLSLANPAAQPRPLDNVQVTIPGSIAAADATVLANGAEYGVLPAGLQYTYSVVFAPLGVASTSPVDGSTSFVGTDLHVVFTSAVNPAGLIACGPGGAPTGAQPGSPSGCNFQLIDTGSGAPVTATPTTASGTPATDIDFALGASLTPGHSYRLTLYGGLYTPAGATNFVVRLANATGTSFLPGNVSTSFTAGSPSVVVSTSPSNGQSGVQVGKAICLSFSGPMDVTTLTPANIHIGYSDLQGTLTLPWSGVSNPSGSTYCLNLTLQSVLDCLGGNRTLLYGATYAVTIGAGVHLAAGNPPSTNLPYSFSFTTQATPPALQPATYANAFVSPRALAGATDVPQDASLSVTLADPTLAWVAASVVSPSVNLVQGTPPFASTPVPVAIGAPVVSGGSFTVKPTAPLAFGTAYTLLLRGGQGGLAAQQGSSPPNWIDPGDGYSIPISFTTAPQTTAVVGPQDNQISSELLIPVVFGRPATLATATSAAITGSVNGAQLSGFVSQFAPVPTAVNYLAQPTWPNNVVLPMAVQMNAGASKVLDEIGNPIASAAANWSSTGNLSAITSQTPSTIVSPSCLYRTAAGGVTQAACGSTGSVNQLLGDTPLRIAFGAGLKERIQPDSIAPGTITLTPVAGGACTASAPVPFTTTFVPGCTLASGCAASPTPYFATAAADQVLITPTGAMVSGCTYTLRIRQSQFTNLYGLVGPGDVSFSVAPAAVSPGLANLSALALVPGGPATPLATSGVTTGLQGRVAISAALTAAAPGSGAQVLDTVAAASVAGNVVGSVVSGPGTFPTGTASASGATITFTPDAGQAFNAGTTYQLTFKGGGIKDLAGNALGADVSVQFTPETVTPTVNPATYVSQSAAFPNGAFKLVFSQPMRAGSFIDPTMAASGTITAGNVSVTDASGNQLLGCVFLDPANPAVAYFEPTGPTGGVITAQTYRVSVAATVADSAGNPLGAAAGPFAVSVTTP